MQRGLVSKGELIGSCGQAAPLLESVDAALDGVALLVSLAVEARWAAASAASPLAVAHLVGRLRDDRADSPTPQVDTDGAGRVGVVGQHSEGPGSRPARAPARDASDPGHHGLESGCVTGLACGDAEGERSCPAVRGQVDLRAQAAAGASECVVGGLAGADRPLLRAPAACWWAQTTVESTDTVQSISGRVPGRGVADHGPSLAFWSRPVRAAASRRAIIAGPGPASLNGASGEGDSARALGIPSA